MVVVAVRKPVPHQFVRWNSALATLPVNAEIHHVETGVFEVWNRTQKQWLRFHMGDYLDITDPQDIYPVNAGAFALNYEVEPPELSLVEQALAVFNPWFDEQLREAGNPEGLRKIRTDYFEAFIAGWKARRGA